MDAVGVRPLGDAAVEVAFGDELSDALNARVMALAADLRVHPLDAAVRDIVPTIASVVVHVDPSATDVDALIDVLRARAGKIHPADFSEAGAVHQIPVRYGGEDGPDLDDVAAFAGISGDDVIARHAAGIYRVYMLGFLPGFAYLGQVDPSIAAPRRAHPRQAVPAGSVGIAGRQTGVYPQVSPGGWQIIGRTSARMFDAASGQTLLQPGDRVQFVPERR